MPLDDGVSLDDEVAVGDMGFGDHTGVDGLVGFVGWVGFVGLGFLVCVGRPGAADGSVDVGVAPVGVAVDDGALVDDVACVGTGEVWVGR